MSTKSKLNNLLQKLESSPIYREQLKKEYKKFKKEEKRKR